MKHLSPLALKRAFAVLAVVILMTTVLPPVTVAAPPKDGGFSYVVQYGDTLFSIAMRFNTSVPAIMTANGLMNDYIFAGQRLIIPNGNPYPPVPQPTPTDFTCKYTVVHRDTLYSIAYRYQTTVPLLMQANYLYSPYIYVNQQLSVPCPSATPTPFPTYTVQSGDNLFRIAIQYNTTIYAIALVNGICNPNWIFAGQTLVIPYPGSYVWPTGIATVTPNGTGTATPTPTATPTGTILPTSSDGNVCTGTCPVVIRNQAYEPATLTITTGSTVTWLNIDTVTHTVTAGTPGNITANSFRSPQLGTNQSFNFTFSTPGTFTYFDEIYGAQMVGTVTVQ